MFDFRFDPALSKTDLYRELADAAEALTEGGPDGIANMANVAALLWHALPGLSWAGFYRSLGNALILGPFQGKPACLRIEFGKGVCGTAALTRMTQLVPVIADGRLVGVLDLDSPALARFDADDRAGLERLVARIAHRL